MPAAAVAKGIILSISIITALSLAVLQNPQVQIWLEEQRQRIAELLRSIGEELDPQTRRTAEAFAFEGRTTVDDEKVANLKREASGSKDAAAFATGRSLSSGAIRRIPIQGPTDPEEAEERRRKGREYLAKRNQEMYELKQKRRAEKGDGAITPPTPTSFDAMVDDEGKLRLLEPMPDSVRSEMREVERNLSQPLLVGESSASAWALGSQLANPFGDEYALDRSETPKPPVPPKIALESDVAPIRSMPGSFTPSRVEAPSAEFQESYDNLSYEEQLAIALSLSEAETASSTAPREEDREDEDADLRAAIAASLQEHSSTSAFQDPETADLKTPRLAPQNPHLLVDLSPPSPTLSPRQPAARGQWETFFDPVYSPIREPLSLAHSQSEPEEEEDELYRVTPEFSRARLASPPASTQSTPYDPVREAASQLSQQALLESSFYSAASSAPSPASSHTMEHEATPQLIDVNEDVPRAPASHSSFGFQTDTESDSDTFASMSAPESRAQSRPRSEVSTVEVLDVDDSDVDMLSEEGDGIATPDSWTDVGSRDGESEVDEDEHRQRGVL